MIRSGLVLAAMAAAAPAQEAFTLPNGLRVHLLEDHRHPLVRVQVRIPWPPGGETQPGLLRFLVEAWQSVPFQPTLEGLATFEAGMDAEGVRLDLAFRSQDQEVVLGALARFILRPGFTGPGLEAQRLRTLRRLESQGPHLTARQQWLDRVSGRPSLTIPVLGGLGLESLEARHRSFLDPTRARLGLTGDLDPAQARQLLLLTLGTWSSQPGPAAGGGPEPRVASHPEGPPEAWVAARLEAPTPRARAARELLVAWSRGQGPASPLQGQDDRPPCLLARWDAEPLQELPARLEAAPTAWIRWCATLDESGLAGVREREVRRRRAEAASPSARLARQLSEAQGGPTLADFEAVTLADIQALVGTAAERCGLFLQGLPPAQVGAWVKAGALERFR